MGGKSKSPYRTDKTLQIELVAYSAKENYIQVRINGILTKYRLQGLIDPIVEQLKLLVKHGSFTEALKLLRRYQVPGSRVEVDIYDGDGGGDD